MNKTNTLIIGAGPAGITAAIQLKRYDLAPILLEKDRIGGLLRNANLVENYPGFPHGIPGPKLIDLFEKQMQRVGVAVTYGEVLKLIFEDNMFVVDVGQVSIPAIQGRVRNPPYIIADAVYHAQVVIIASGTKARPIPIAIPPQAQGRIFSEVWPLLEEKNKHIAIVGAGDTAFDYALNLARKNTVTILNRSNETTCLPLLWERAQKSPNIAYLAETTISGIEADESANVKAAGSLKAADRLRVRYVSTDYLSNDYLFTDYLLFAIGREPQMDFLSERVKLQAQRLAEDGKLYLVGDVHNDLFRQTAIAAGEGLRAAMQIYAQMSLRGA